MSERQVWRILDSLEAKGAIVVTQEGGNKVFKGAATVYKILTHRSAARVTPMTPLRMTPMTLFTTPTEVTNQAARVTFRARRVTFQVLEG